MKLDTAARYLPTGNRPLSLGALRRREFRVTADRGRPFPLPVSGGQCFATVHPSSILRGSPADREVAYRQFVADLRAAYRSLTA